MGDPLHPLHPLLLFILLFSSVCGRDGGASVFKPNSLFSLGRMKKAQVNYRKEEAKILDSVMGASVYDSRIRPSGINGTDSATSVYVNIFVRSFSKIDDVKMEYSFQITMRQQWNDDRLSYKEKLTQLMAERIKYLTLTDSSKVWMPDTFFRNEKIGAFHNILTPNLYIRIFPDGDVLFSIRISITCACSMHLALFPLDEQTCSLDVASYGWTKNDLVYVWKSEGNPVQLAPNLTLPGGFKLGAFGSKYCDVITATGAYSCLRVELLFVRQLSFFVVTVYVPCTMTVSVSWMSFWLDHKAVPARVALGVTTLLAMSTTQASIQNSLPPVAYTKAIDVWSGVCVFFVFSALLEYALVNYASRSDAQRSVKQKERKKQELERQVFNADQFEEGPPPMSMDPLMRRIDGSHMIPPSAVIHHRLPIKRPNRFTSWISNFQFQAKKIDVFSRAFFPFLFFVFNCWYWSYYLTRAQGKSQE